MNETSLNNEPDIKHNLFAESFAFAYFFSCGGKIDFGSYLRVKFLNEIFSATKHLCTRLRPTENISPYDI